MTDLQVAWFRKCAHHLVGEFGELQQIVKILLGDRQALGQAPDRKMEWDHWSRVRLRSVCQGSSPPSSVAAASAARALA